MRESIKQYFKEKFNKKQVIIKTIILVIAAIVVLIPSISFFFWLKDKPNGVVGKENGFWYIDVIWNKGMGFSALDGKTTAILAIQSVMFVALMCIYWFLSHSKFSCSFLALAIFGGLFNLIQRGSMPDKGVLDYFRFGFWKSFATFNWPDMFVVIGLFGFVIAIIVGIILESKREKDKANEAKNEAEVPVANN